jgi:hypothetical protein
MFSFAYTATACQQRCLARLCIIANSGYYAGANHMGGSVHRITVLFTDANITSETGAIVGFVSGALKIGEKRPSLHRSKEVSNPSPMGPLQGIGFISVAGSLLSCSILSRTARNFQGFIKHNLSICT